FIAECPQREAVLYRLQAGRLQHSPRRVREQRSVVLLVGQVASTPLARDALPARSALQPRVQPLLREAAPIAQEGRW
ncbi:hypothetical protein, partial [Stenotrophomonas sp. SrG]|uniref:hypothetical protein n=1 Tax=Stenotrophomonas sp. SrG TaxID=3414430 RepID=UPI003CF8EBE8